MQVSVVQSEGGAGKCGAVCVYRHKNRMRRTLLFLVYGGVFALSCCCPAVAGAGVLFDSTHGPGVASAFGALDARANAEAAAKAALGKA